MPANEEPKQDESVRVQTAAADLEKKVDEIQADDADTIAGGFSQNNGGDGTGR